MKQYNKSPDQLADLYQLHALVSRFVALRPDEKEYEEVGLSLVVICRRITDRGRTRPYPETVPITAENLPPLSLAFEPRTVPEPPPRTVPVRTEPVPTDLLDTEPIETDRPSVMDSDRPSIMDRVKSFFAPPPRYSGKKS